jgi:acyl-coenzyme A synthetase/AMP-(fatty) acid ligase
VTTGDDLAAMAADALASDPAREAIEYEDRWVRWGELARTADAVRRAIDATWADRAAPVAFVGRSHPSGIAALLGLIAARRSVQMIYPFLGGEAIAREIAKLSPAILIAPAETLDEAVLASARTEGAAVIALRDFDVSAVPGFERTDDRPHPAPEPRIEVLTSGTTGPPKRFPVLYAMIATHLVGPYRPAEGASPGLLYFPLGNISGLYTTLPPLLRGQRVSLMDRFSIAGWHAYVVRHRPVASGVPPSCVRALLDADIPREDLASIKTMGMGAAPLDPVLQRAFEDRYGIPMLLSYGATEFGGPVSAMTPDLRARYGEAKATSAGRSLPGARLRVVDADSGEELPPDTEGLLEVVSPRLGSGWLRTADLATIDADGFLYIRGRADGAIIRGGFKIVPETIERALLSHSAVAAAAIVAVPDDRLGEVPGAAIQPAPGATVTPALAEAHLRGHLPATHIPAHWRFVEDLPKNPSMKIDRPAVKALFDDR